MDTGFDRVLELDFDDVEGELEQGSRLPDTGGSSLAGEVQLGGDGTQPLQGTDGADGGRAIRFPEPCQAADGSCPKAVVELVDDDALVPGTRDFRYGATVLIAPDETSDGANVWQKGFANGGGSQWKLQVDGRQGYPSCVLVGTEEGESFKVVGSQSVADGRWHELRCSRVEESLVLEVDGEEADREAVPAEVRVAPMSPARIGGKNVKPNNDQFFGAIDDVLLEVATQ